MLKIGEFSKLASVTVKTLRHYSRIGLLSPVHIDRYTGYRYYMLRQLPRLNRILALKGAGFILEEITLLLNEDMTPAKIGALLGAKQNELHQRLETEKFRLEQVNARIKQIEQEGFPSQYDPIIKSVPEIPAAAIHQRIPNIANLAQRRIELHKELSTWAQINNLRAEAYWLTIYHNQEYTEADVELEIILPLAEIPKRFSTTSHRINLSVVKQVDEMASVLHTGKLDTLPRAVAELTGWIQANGYITCGPNRELALQDNDTGEDNCTLFEVQIPVEKALNRFQRQQINQSQKENDMEPRFETRPAFMVAGMMYRGKNENQDIKAMWEKFNLRCCELQGADLKETYGVCFTLENAEEGVFEYVAGAKVNTVDTLPENMVVRFIPEQKYAIFTVRGAIEGIPETYSYIYESWLPQSDYELASTFDFEMYDAKFNNFAEDSELYLFIPIKEG
jgi:predicted transcriptional regulator YdeE/DNA-binding transcriptional MerR regulator